MLGSLDEQNVYTRSSDLFRTHLWEQQFHLLIMEIQLRDIVQALMRTRISTRYAMVTPRAENTPYSEESL